MNNYIRLTYASTTTSKPATIRQDLVAILNEAQLHNSNNNVFGVFFMAITIFFNVLRATKPKLTGCTKSCLKTHAIRIWCCCPIHPSIKCALLAGT